MMNWSLLRVQTAVEHRQERHASQDQERSLDGDGIMTSNEEQHSSHKEGESL